ncbi:MAG: hypothetical protein COW02_16425 [Comamonadaceae bacterium CG12_big_fil_rev_8_21_14_0_65_59_15]|nr:MAG: hypothetical protein COW02_16425 [Comamonadaceae bacterium CG12_big_fil_rev_8_21_14_0_65_59_15]
MDFNDAQLPIISPLAGSFTENDVESDLKKLFSDLFGAKQAALAFDANVLGSAHLGSFDLIRKSVNTDGLVLLSGEREEAATRYLYRAWKSGDVQGRGLHFLRTYLQMLYPNLCQIEQLWQDKSRIYPTSLVANKPRVNYWIYALGESGLKLDGLWGVGAQRPVVDFEAEASRMPDLSNMFLTSRVEITLDFAVQIKSIINLMGIIRSIIPARLLPHFRFTLTVLFFIQASLSTWLLLQKKSRLRYPWNGRVVTDSDDAVWRLGIGDDLVRLPQAFGMFRLGQARGGVSAWHLKSARIESHALMQSHASSQAFSLQNIGQTWRRLDASWRLGARAMHASGAAFMSKSAAMLVSESLQTTQHEFVRMDYPRTPQKLGAWPRLGAWRRLNGAWAVGVSGRPFGFALRRDEPVLAESSALMASNAATYASPEKLTLPWSSYQKTPPRLLLLDGSWLLGGPCRPVFAFKATKVLI